MDMNDVLQIGAVSVALLISLAWVIKRVRRMLKGRNRDCGDCGCCDGCPLSARSCSKKDESRNLK